MRLTVFVVLLLAFACTPMREDEGSKSDSSADVQVEPDMGNISCPTCPSKDESECKIDCTIWLDEGKTGATELWVLWQQSGSCPPPVTYATFGCAPDDPAGLQDVPFNPNGPDADMFLEVPSGHSSVCLRSGNDGWPYAGFCQMLDGITWQETSEGGYLKLPGPI